MCEWCVKWFAKKESLDEHIRYKHPEHAPETSQNQTSLKEIVNTEEGISNSETMSEIQPVLTEMKPRYNRKPNPNARQMSEITITCPDCNVQISGKENMAKAGIYRYFL